jgi:hypothetical protein
VVAAGAGGAGPVVVTGDDDRVGTVVGRAVGRATPASAGVVANAVGRSILSPLGRDGYRIECRRARERNFSANVIFRTVDGGVVDSAGSHEPTRGERDDVQP